MRIRVVQGGLCAEVEVTPGPAAGVDALSQALARAGVRHGVDQAVVDDLGARLADPELRHRGVIAQGTAPVPGRDGVLEFAVPVTVQPGEVATDQSIDWRERHLLHPIADAEPIARWQAPVAGSPGTSVLGAAIPPPPVQRGLPALGSGVALQPDGSILAVRDGAVHHQPGRLLDVVELWQHRGDVDVATGNLHTRGSLVVKGNVCEGAAVDAGCDLLVQGAVFSARLQAAGDVTVQQGIQGTGSGAIAGGELTCRHATVATLQASGTVRVRDQLVNCHVRAERILVEEGRACVVGGELRARRAVRVGVAGSAAGTPTLLAAADLSDVAADLLAAERDREHAARRTAKLQLLGERGKGGKLGRRAVDDRAESARLDLLRRQRELLAEARIHVAELAHPGVRIVLGRASLLLQAPVHGASFRFDSATDTIVKDRP